MSRQYYLFGSYDFSVETNTIIQPSFLVKMSEQLKPQVDIGATYIYNDGFWAGLAYRTSGALIAKYRSKSIRTYFLDMHMIIHSRRFRVLPTGNS